MKPLLLFLLLCMIASSKMPDKHCYREVYIEQRIYLKGKKVFTDQLQKSGYHGSPRPVFINGKKYTADSIVYELIAK